MATTLAHLLLEGPALLTFAAAALKGSKTDRHDVTMCLLNTGNNFLSIVNATIPFFLYLACNEQFRRMTFVYLRMRFCGIDSGADDTLNAERSQSTHKKRWLPRLTHSSLSLRNTVTVHLDDSRRSFCSSERDRHTVAVGGDDAHLRPRPRPFPASTSSSRCSFDVDERRLALPTNNSHAHTAVDQDSASLVTNSPLVDAVSLTEGDENDRLIQLCATTNCHVRFDNQANHSDRREDVMQLDPPSPASIHRPDDKKHKFDDLIVKVSTI